MDEHELMIARNLVHWKKIPYIYGYFVASFPYFDGTAPSLFRRFTDTNAYGTGSIYIMENSVGWQTIRGYTDIFTVYVRRREWWMALVISVLHGY